MIILGVNAYHPDSSAALVVDGKLIAASEEERFRRIKHFFGFPAEAIKYCMQDAGVSVQDIDYIVIPRDPKARLIRKICYGVKNPVFAKSRLFAWRETFQIKEKLAKIFDIDKRKIKARIIKVEHHRAHMASSFFLSGFKKSFILSMDAMGDFASTMWAIGEGSKIRVLGEINFPHSLGFFYTAITQYLGFLNFGDEYKIMGLASFGEETFKKEFEEILSVKKNRFKLNLKYFLHHKKDAGINFEKNYFKSNIIFSNLLEKKLGKRRQPGEKITGRHKDIAFSLQKRLERAIMSLAATPTLRDSPNLCLSGGVAHNSAANGKLLEKMKFENIYIPPAPGDAGLAIGAAFYLWNQMLKKPRSFQMEHAYWGPAYGENEIESAIRLHKTEFNKARYIVKKAENDDMLCKKIASEISTGKIVGWFQGRMEFGPRALGNRSILADPRKNRMKDILNEKIKLRENFRPFAPSVLEEDTNTYFEQSHPSPFMSLAHGIRSDKKNLIPAVCHVDGTARFQTVNKKTNPLYWRLIEKFKSLTGVPVLLNTSFNENEPIICSPDEAIDCFLRTKMDILVLERFIIEKG